MSAARLLVRCPDGPGIVAAIAGFLSERGANITEATQYSNGTFLQRTVFELPGVHERRRQLEAEFAAVAVAARFAMDWRIELAERPKRVALFVSRRDHCLLDLLWRARRGELPIEVDVVEHVRHAHGCPGSTTCTRKRSWRAGGCVNLVHQG